MDAQEKEVRLPEGMRIVRATEEDMDYVMSCVRDSIERSVTDGERDLSDLWIDAILSISADSMSSGRIRDEVFVLKDSDSGYAGSLWLGVSADQFTCEETGYLLGIFVEPSLRRRGIGAALLGFAEGWCRDNGYLHLTLNVGWHNESARRFYESHGYGVRSEVRRKGLYPTL